MPVLGRESGIAECWLDKQVSQNAAMNGGDVRCDSIDVKRKLGRLETKQC